MLGLTTASQAKSTEKLSSGYKINRAADDAAGLSISEKMRKQIRGLTQASTNAQDGVSAVQTAEGALTEVHDMLQRMNELATQAANGSNSQTDRDAIQNEIDQLTVEIDRVAETTKFNETYLLKGSDGKKQVTLNAHDAGLKGALTTAADGKTASFKAESLKSGDSVSIAGKNYKISDTATTKVSMKGSTQDLYLASGAKADTTGLSVEDAATLGLYKKAVGDTTSSPYADKGQDASALISTATVANGAISSTGITYASAVNHVYDENLNEVDATKLKSVVDVTVKSGATVYTSGVSSALTEGSTLEFDKDYYTETTAATLGNPTGQTSASAATASAATTFFKDGQVYNYNAGDALADELYTQSLSGTQVGVNASASTLLDFTATNGAVASSSLTYKTGITDVFVQDGDKATELTTSDQFKTASKLTATSVLHEAGKGWTSGKVDAGAEVQYDTTYYKEAASQTAADLDASGQTQAATIMNITTGETITLSAGSTAISANTTFNTSGGTSVRADAIWQTVGASGSLNSNWKVVTAAAQTDFELIATKDMGSTVDNDLADGVKTVTQATAADIEVTANQKIYSNIKGEGALTADDLEITQGSEITASQAYTKMADALLQANQIGVDNVNDVAVKDNGDGSFDITMGTVEVANGLSFGLHVGADADMTNKIQVDIETMNSAYLGVQGLNVSDDSGMSATYAVDAIADAIQKVSEQRSTLGAIQNRLEHTINNLGNVVENTTSAESNIRDTDMATEMVKYSNNNILAQAGQAMLAQANQSNQGVLSLLG